MGLKELKFPEATIKTPGGDITVRGLSLRDITELVRRHKAAFEGLFNDVTSGKADLDSLTNGDTLIAMLAQTAPELAAEVIAAGAGDGGDLEAIEVAKSLPFPTQVELLEQIGLLTFAMEGGLKKVVETVTRVMQSSTNALESVSASKAGSGR